MKGLFIFIPILICIKSFAICDLQGKILVSETGKSPDSLKIKLYNSVNRYETNGNEHGLYYFLGIQNGIYTLELSYSGKKYLIKNIVLHEEETRELSFDISISNSLPDLIEINDPGPQVVNNGYTERDPKVKYNGPPADMSQVVQKSYVDFQNGKMYIKGSSDVKYYIDGSPVMGKPVIPTGQ